MFPELSHTPTVTAKAVRLFAGCVELTIGVNELITRVRLITVTGTLPVTAGLLPEAGHVATTILDPAAAKYIDKLTVPVVTVEVVVPDIEYPLLSLRNR